MTWIEYLAIFMGLVVLVPFAVYILVRVGAAAYFRSFQDFIRRTRNNDKN